MFGNLYFISYDESDLSSFNSNTDAPFLYHERKEANPKRANDALVSGRKQAVACGSSPKSRKISGIHYIYANGLL